MRRPTGVPMPQWTTVERGRLTHGSASTQAVAVTKECATHIEVSAGRVVDDPVAVQLAFPRLLGDSAEPSCHGRGRYRPSSPSADVGWPSTITSRPRLTVRFPPPQP